MLTDSNTSVMTIVLRCERKSFFCSFQKVCEPYFKLVTVLALQAFVGTVSNLLNSSNVGLWKLVQGV